MASTKPILTSIHGLEVRDTELSQQLPGREEAVADAREAARMLEGELQFPLAPGQSIAGFALDVDGVLRDAVPVDKPKAQAIFDALPALAAGETVELRIAAERLRDAKLLSKSGPATKLCGLFPELCEWRPEKQLHHVQRRAGR